MAAPPELEGRIMQEIEKRMKSLGETLPTDEGIITGDRISNLRKLKKALIKEKRKTQSSSTSVPSYDLKDVEFVAKNMLSLVYHGGLFDVKNEEEINSAIQATEKEKARCLQDSGITADELSAISDMARLLTKSSAAMSEGSSHKDALKKNVDYAKAWLFNPEKKIMADDFRGKKMTYGDTRKVLERIRESKFFSSKPSQ